MKKYKFTQEEILKNGKIIRHLVLDIEDSSKWRELFEKECFFLNARFKYLILLFEQSLT